MGPNGKAAFEMFKVKRESWIDWYSGEDRHSIIYQIHTMTWDAAVYRVINEARKYAKVTDKGCVELNGMIHILIDKCFFENQGSAIRRLVDRERSTGKRSVYSLYRLIDDMEQNSNLLTRENYFAVEELAYDDTAVREAYDNYVKEQIQDGKKAYGIPSKFNWRRIENRHKQIDTLSRVDKSQRSPNDQVCSELFINLKTMLGVCDGVVTNVDKFVAHAATPDSRAAAQIEEPSLTLGHLWNAHEAICKVASFIDLYLLRQSSHSFLATPIFNQFKYIDRALITSDNISHLRDIWQQYSKETQTWSQWGLNELEKMVGQ